MRRLLISRWMIAMSLVGLAGGDLGASVGSPRAYSVQLAESCLDCPLRLFELLFGEMTEHTSAKTTTSPGAPPEAEPDTNGDRDVVLLDAGEPVDEAKLVATMATVLRSGNFRPEVVSEVQNRYFGYMIDRRQRDGVWEFTGPAQGFTARYGASQTTGWPDRTPFLLEDSRRNAASLHPVPPPDGSEHARNLRIYHRPNRIGFRDEHYETEDTLVMTYLDPQSGRSSAYVYRRQGEDYELYRYAPASIPSRTFEASVVSVMGVATTDTIRIPILITTISVPVPRNTYSRGMFREFNGRNYDGTETPMGPPVRFTGISREAGREPFEAVLKAVREGSALGEKEFGRVHLFLRQVHQHLVEKPAGAE